MEPKYMFAAARPGSAAKRWRRDAFAKGRPGLLRSPYNRAYVVLLALVCFLIGSSVKAEILVLRSGVAVEGRILHQSPRAIYVRLLGGKTRTIRKSHLRSIQYVPLTPAQKKSLRATRARRRAAWRARIRRIKRAKVQREQRLRELNAAIQAEKKKEALARSRRAAALRELVQTRKMKKPEDEAISYWDFAWRSLVLPGWGHFKLDRPTIGAVYMAGTAGFLGAVYRTRRIASAAQRENSSQVQQNFILSLATGQAALSVRTFYAYYANARAAVDYKGKIDRYHGALYSLGLFYGIQLLHIIYNAIAWEQGLLIVHGTGATPATFSTEIAIIPLTGDGRGGADSRNSSGAAIRIGARWSW